MKALNKKISIVLIIFALLLAIKSHYFIALVITAAALILWFDINLKKAKLDKFVEKDPPTNYTFFSNEKKKFK